TCPCTVDADCKDKTRGRCGPGNVCVECVSTPADTCTAGGYCNEKNQCAVGCKSDPDCPSGQHCQPTSHQCVACTSDTQGPGKEGSPSGNCVDSGPGNGPGPGGVCCNGLCLSGANDVLNRGGCGTACSTENGTPTCAGGKCSWKCVDGYAH